MQLIILDDIENLPLGTHVTIQLSATASMRAVSFGSNFGLASGRTETAETIRLRGWRVILGW